MFIAALILVWVIALLMQRKKPPVLEGEWLPAGEDGRKRPEEMTLKDVKKRVIKL